MAAPLKTGLDYFPFWVTFFENDKIKILRAKFGGDKAATVIVRLLTKIYARGYYYKWTADEKLLLVLDMGGDFTDEYIDKVVNAALDYGFFDKPTFERDEVLTSKAIQENYVEATKRRKINMDSEPFWLLSSQKTPQKVVNVDINPVNDNINPQSRVEKINKKNIKKKFTPPTIQEVETYFSSEKEIPQPKAHEAAERFWCFYDSKDWMVGKTKMANWRSAATISLKWQSNKQSPSNNGTQQFHPTSINL